MRPCNHLSSLVAMQLIAGASVLSAQAWNAPTATETYVGSDTSLIEGYRYTNWAWVDPTGVSHSFPGQTQAVMKYQASIDQGRINGHPMITSLVNVPAADGSPFYLNVTGGTGAVTAVAEILPKFQVLSVLYAPPGASSHVDYGTNSTLGTSTSVAASFASSSSLSATVGGSFFGLVNGTTTYSAGYSQAINSATSIALTRNQSSTLSIPGPANSLGGINHDFDIILVCLNPKISMAATSPTTAQWTVAVDTRDTAASGMAEIIPLYVYQLKNPASITDPNLLSRLQRDWAGAGGALTNTDLAEIAGRDPFWNDGTAGSSPAAGNPRYQLLGNSTFPYVPPPVGGQPVTTTYNLQYQTLSTASKSATDTFTVSSSSQGDVNFLISAKIVSTSQYTWTNQVTQSSSNGSGLTAGFTLTGPPAQYTGPVGVKVYQDVVYGSFLFSYVQ